MSLDMSRFLSELPIPLKMLRTSKPNSVLNLVPLPLIPSEIELINYFQQQKPLSNILFGNQSKFE